MIVRIYFVGGYIQNIEAADVTEVGTDLILTDENEEVKAKFDMAKCVGYQIKEDEECQ